MNKLDRHDFNKLLKHVKYGLTPIEWYRIALKAYSIEDAIQWGLSDNRISFDEEYKDFSDLLRIVANSIRKTDNLMKGLLSGLHHEHHDLIMKQENEKDLFPEMSFLNSRLTRHIKALFSERNDCFVLKDLEKFKLSDFTDRRNFGKKTLQELSEFMERNNLKFKEEAVEYED